LRAALPSVLEDGFEARPGLPWLEGHVANYCRRQKLCHGGLQGFSQTAKEIKARRGLAAFQPADVRPVNLGARCLFGL